MFFHLSSCFFGLERRVRHRHGHIVHVRSDVLHRLRRGIVAHYLCKGHDGRLPNVVHRASERPPKCVIREMKPEDLPKRDDDPPVPTVASRRERPDAAAHLVCDEQIIGAYGRRPPLLRRGDDAATVFLILRKEPVCVLMKRYGPPLASATTLPQDLDIPVVDPILLKIHALASPEAHAQHEVHGELLQRIPLIVEQLLCLLELQPIHVRAVVVRPPYPHPGDGVVVIEAHNRIQCEDISTLGVERETAARELLVHKPSDILFHNLIRKSCALAGGKDPHYGVLSLVVEVDGPKDARRQALQHIVQIRFADGGRGIRGSL